MQHKVYHFKADSRIKRLTVDWSLLTVLIGTLLGFIFLHDLFGGTLLKHNDWDSYTLQALAWRHGQLGLGQNYSWLELAYYNGNYYVSFPPVPSLVMLPLTFYYGEKTPNNLVMVLYVLVCLTLAYRIVRAFGGSKDQATFWSVFTVLGCNLLWMSIDGGVWFQAQSLNMLLCLAAILSAIKDKRVLSLTFLALAVGCRPFSICYFPALMIYFILRDQQVHPDRPIVRLALRQWKTLIAPAVIGAVYMLYNAARFGNPLEFGHNYLPEFIAAQDGQFNLNYLINNLLNIFFRPVTMTKTGALRYPVFDGFMFYIANPIFIVFFVWLLRDIVRKRFNVLNGTLCLCLAANLILLALHKTFGGWQFGARYTVDLIPFVLFYLILGGRKKAAGWEKALGIFAIMFNVYGALAMVFLYGYN